MLSVWKMWRNWLQKFSKVEDEYAIMEETNDDVVFEEIVANVIKLLLLWRTTWMKTLSRKCLDKVFNEVFQMLLWFWIFFSSYLILKNIEINTNHHSMTKLILISKKTLFNLPLWRHHHWLVHIHSVSSSDPLLCHFY